ncbi:MAG: translation initiation factor IF-2 N-terminal domain-containing protein, partial [Lachnospiraceae bacterium]|nr:translation initiation factor IF-2 N-terminal domain-containing protein [Lachnospiraceae bacterium]
MAKIKVSELAAELGCESKELIAFLQESGIEAKRSNSSIEEVDAERARKRFVTSPSRREKEGSVKTKQDHKEELMEQKKEKEVQPEKVAAPSGAKENATPPQKKKKKIIFVSNPNNSKFGGAHPTQQTENGKKRGTAGKSGFAVSQNAYRPIKPLTKPKQLEEYGNSLRKPLPTAPKSTIKDSEQNQNEMPLSPAQNNVEVVEKVKNGASPESREQSQPKKNNKPFSERNGKGGAAPGAKDSQGRGQKDAQGRNLKEGSRSGAGKNPRLDAPRDNAPAKQANGKNAKGDHHAKTA